MLTISKSMSSVIPDYVGNLKIKKNTFEKVGRLKGWKVERLEG